MDHILNLKAIAKKMSESPKGQRIYHFFYGLNEQLTSEQIKEVRKIIVGENKKIINYIDKSLKTKNK